jgi:hypothetical protein
VYGTDDRLLSATKAYTNTRASWLQYQPSGCGSSVVHRRNLEHRTVRDPAYERSGAKYIVRR